MDHLGRQPGHAPGQRVRQHVGGHPGQPLDLLLRRGDLGRVEAELTQLVPHPVPANLVQLVHGDEERILRLRRHPAVRGQRGQEPPV